MGSQGARIRERVLKWVLDLAIRRESGYSPRPYSLFALSLAVLLTITSFVSSAFAVGDVFGISDVPGVWFLAMWAVVVIWIIRDAVMLGVTWYADDLWARLSAETREAYRETRRPDVVTRRR